MPIGRNRATRGVVQFRAVDLVPGDVIQIKHEQTPIWVEVQAVYFGQEGAADLQQIADQVRSGYKTKQIKNISVALFIDGHGEGTHSGGRLDRIKSGLSMVVQVRNTLEPYDDANWREFRCLALVDTQRWS